MTMAAFDLDEPVPFEHVSVLLNEVVHALEPERGGLFVDLTAGGGGHSAALLSASNSARLIAFDRDLGAVEAARLRLAEFGERACVVHASFDRVRDELLSMGIHEVDGLLADLGVSSHQLADSERGMSFRLRGPLDMR